MSKENFEIRYLKKRLDDLQQYINREIQMITEELKRLDDTQQDRTVKVTTEIKTREMMNMWDRIPDVLTPNDIQRILKIGRNQSYNLVNSGQLHYVRVGSKYLIPKQSFIDWLEGREHR